jgi:hypothetical protein
MRTRRGGELTLELLDAIDCAVHNAVWRRLLTCFRQAVYGNPREVLNRVLSHALPKHDLAGFLPAIVSRRGTTP